VDPNAKANMQALRDNPYPGRGIVIGQTPDARHYVQVYWIMGRSENSRNRVFVAEADLVRTAPYDQSKVKDPSLIIYNCARAIRRAGSIGRCHIVSNGDQTDTVFDVMSAGGTFEEALSGRDPEPDAPNSTARITGLVDLDDKRHAYKLSIIKAAGNDPARCQRHLFCYEKGVPGIGHCIHTYSGDGSPLPPFAGEPYPVPVPGDADGVAKAYWDVLNEDNKVSLMVKLIDARTGASQVRIINKHT
jgi:IMP cyclohydrolase